MVDLNKVYKENKDKIDSRVGELMQIENLIDENEKLREVIELYKKCSCGCYVNCYSREEARKILSSLLLIRESKD